MIEPKKTSRPSSKFGNRGAWQAEADHMRAHPDETFIIERRPYPDRAAYALAAHVRNGGYVAFRPAGSFNAWVEREGGNVEVIAVYVGEGTQAQEDGQTVASTPALAEETADSDGSEVVWTLVGGSKRNPVHAATILGQDVLHQKGYLWVADGEAAKMTIRPASFEDVRQNAVAYVENYLARKAEAGQDSGGKADDDVDLYALSEDELRSHLESLATPELHKIMESMGMSPFFANRIDAIGVIETKVHYSKAAAASTPAPGDAQDSGGEVESVSALRARLETLPPGDRSDAVVAWIGTLPLNDRFEVITAMTVEHLAETGQSFDDWWREGTGQSFYDWCRARGMADADPKPARKKRTVAVRVEDPEPAPVSWQETVAAPQVPSVEEILPAVKEAASSATKTYLSVGDLAKLTGHAADDISRGLKAVGVVSRRKDGRHQTAALTCVPTRFEDFRVLEIAGGYRNEYAARLPWDFRPDDGVYYDAWQRMACRHLVPDADLDADPDGDGFGYCDCKLVLFYQQDGASDVTALADYGSSPATLPVALTPFATSHP